MTDKSGPAFPVKDPSSGNTHAGMTLRDWFASQTLAGLISYEGAQADDYLGTHTSLAYRYADTMLKERDK